MPVTYKKIASVTVGSGGAASMEFTSIPSTYTDLIVKISGRMARATNGGSVVLSLNGSTSNFTYRSVYGQGSSAVSTNGSTGLIGFAPGANDTASTFGNMEIYIPNYAGSTNKSVSVDSVSENNATEGYDALYAVLWSNTAAITSLNVKDNGASNWVQYSTATLYGISKS